ncbi:hypothetical protein N9W89_13275 [Hellea sp.]|nr:hypothetical protein [Hellea sp.]
MTYFKTLSALGVMGTLMLAPAAFAGDMNKAPQKSDAAIMKAEQTEAAMIKAENTQVLAAVETVGAIPVQAEDGKVFYNHYVTDAELNNVTTDVKTLDTYTFEYNGVTYTNKVVAE